MTAHQEYRYRYHVLDPEEPPRFFAPLTPRLDHLIYYESNGLILLFFYLFYVVCFVGLLQFPFPPLGRTHAQPSRVWR